MLLYEEIGILWLGAKLFLCLYWYSSTPLRRAPKNFNFNCPPRGVVSNQR